MRLKKTQKEAALRWIAEGLKSDEINELAAAFVPPFSITRDQVYYYRKTRAADIAVMVAAGEQDALSEGLALRGNRVKKLKQLAALLERDLLGGFLWTEQVKSVREGDTSRVVEFEEFNSSEVAAYRGVLDDIAKEMGGRSQKHEHTGKDGSDLLPIDRMVAALETIRKGQE